MADYKGMWEKSRMLRLGEQFTAMHTLVGVTRWFHTVDVFFISVEAASLVLVRRGMALGECETEVV